MHFREAKFKQNNLRERNIEIEKDRGRKKGIERMR